MVRVSKGKRLSLRFALVVALLVFAAVLTACAAPSGPGGGQAARSQSAAPTEILKQAAATTAPAAATQAPAAATEAPAAATTAPAAPTEAQAPAPAAGVSFSKHVRPIFEQSCVKCHGGSDGTKGDLSLKTFDDIMTGGQHGAAIVPGDATGSLLVKQIQSGKMPKRGQKLPLDQVDLIAKWVAEGAKNN